MNHIAFASSFPTNKQLNNKMYKIVAFLALLAVAAAKPSLAPAALVAPAPLVAAPAPFVTASSSQYIARNYNGLVAAPLVAPAPVLPAPFVAPAARIVAPAAPFVAPAAPLVAPSPFLRYAAAAPYYAPSPFYPSAPYVAL